MPKKAFTLVELIIVVIIIGILAAFAVPAYQNAARRQAVKLIASNLTLLHEAEKIYRMEKGSWPLCNEPTDGTVSSCNELLRLNLAGVGKNPKSKFLSWCEGGGLQVPPCTANYFLYYSNSGYCTYEYVETESAPRLDRGGLPNCLPVQ